MSSSPRVRVGDLNASAFSISGDAANHLGRVLRLDVGDVVIAYDGAGSECTCVIRDILKGCAGTPITLSPVEGPRAGVAADSARVTLLHGLARGDRFESLIDMATQLGVAEIVPVRCERSIVRGDERETKRGRYALIAESSAQQCRRADLPVIHPAAAFSKAIAALDVGISTRIVAWEEGGTSLVEALTHTPSGPMAVLVGPEGGLTRDEVDLAVSHGFTVVSLGPRILRTEVAGAAVLAIASAIRGDLARK